jgi:hypothetical protein
MLCHGLDPPVTSKMESEIGSTTDQPTGHAPSPARVPVRAPVAIATPTSEHARA